jgi:hypothetical protein
MGDFKKETRTITFRVKGKLAIMEHVPVNAF